MSIFLHITFAILSLIITGITAVVPTTRRLRITAVSIVLTVGSGVMLAVVNHALILHVCTTGLTYLAIESVGVIYSVNRLRSRSRA
jgi:hypothetical protein